MENKAELGTAVESRTKHGRKRWRTTGQSEGRRWRRTGRLGALSLRGEGHHTRVVNINLGEFMMPLEVTNETPKRKNFPPGVEKTCLSVSV